MRTSITHPLLIAEIEVAPNFGKIGVTFAPGKVQARSVSGPWARDLATDLDVVARWNAAAVVTLIEEREMKALKVAEMGAMVADRHMAWYHLPIVDVSTPDDAFEAAWRDAGRDLRARLRSGANVLVHCRGGLGRAGTIAARLLVELGWEPAAAIAAVRKVRPGAIETRAQERHVQAARAVPEPLPDATEAALRDRAVGAMLGLAVGDAVGTTLEFTRRDSQPRLRDMVGGGPFRLEAGQWTDDTSMALALADSLEADPTLDEADLMRRFVQWHEEGAYSATGRCFDIGITTRQALSRWKRSGDPVAGSGDPATAGNGSLMRLAPVPVRHWRDPARLRDVAARQSRTTHGAAEAVDACVAYAQVLADAIAGQPRGAVLRSRDDGYAGAVAAIMAGSWRGKTRSAIRASGYVAHALEAALWCVGRTTSFEDAVLLAANLGEDADTTAAIAGQLAGALYGASGIPARWLERLAWQERIAHVAGRLFEAGQGDESLAVAERDEPLIAAIHAAMQSGYLGSPDVIRSLLVPLVDVIIGVWRHRTDKSAPVVVPADVQAASGRIVGALSGNDPAYGTMPWHCVGQLGRNLVSAMNLDREYCEGESLAFLLLEAVAAFTNRANELLREYVHTDGADWKRDIEPRLIRLVQFFETVLLGTNSVFFPGLSLGDLD